jgi:hypothetical protein
MTAGAWFVILCILQMIDIKLTTGILKRGGRELNPLMARRMDSLGVAKALWIAKTLSMGLCLLLLYHNETTVLAALCSIYFFVCAWNWCALHKMT